MTEHDKTRCKRRKADTRSSLAGGHLAWKDTNQPTTFSDKFVNEEACGRANLSECSDSTCHRQRDSANQALPPSPFPSAAKNKVPLDSIKAYDTILSRVKKCVRSSKMKSGDLQCPCVSPITSLLITTGGAPLQTHTFPYEHPMLLRECGHIIHRRHRPTQHCRRGNVFRTRWQRQRARRLFLSKPISTMESGSKKPYHAISELGTAQMMYLFHAWNLEELSEHKKTWLSRCIHNEIRNCTAP